MGAARWAVHGSVSVHAELQRSAIRLFPVSAQEVELCGALPEMPWRRGAGGDQRGHRGH